MSAAERPWWASEGDAPVDDVDPVEAHRRARRPSSEPPGPDDDGSWWVPASEAVTRLVRDLTASATASPPRGLADDLFGGDDRTTTDDPERPRTSGGGGGDGPDGHTVDACGICPICVGLRALGDARPDLVVHLAEAARQLALAVRTVVDAAADGDEATADRSGAASGRRSRRDGLQHIDLDED
ncbi:MAG: hypothetical protein WD010_09950 [Nitriliruptor sp.]|uniref:hypothetical protein n=1 Tax=Nitriliruptor sp. TaxID=2448056 RepID=UPI0034A01501